MTHDAREETCLRRPCRRARQIVRENAFSPFPAGEAVRIMGMREQIHPADAYATLLPTISDAEVWRAANEAHYGHPGWVVPIEGGAVQVIDLRPMLAESGVEPTDPALPD